jgi:hypothetical protein
MQLSCQFIKLLVFSRIAVCSLAFHQLSVKDFDRLDFLRVAGFRAFGDANAVLVWVPIRV